MTAADSIMFDKGDPAPTPPAQEPVQRFDLSGGCGDRECGCYTEMKREADGPYVKFSAYDTLAQRVRELEHLQKTCGEVQPIDLTQSGTASSDPVDVDPFWLAQWRTIPDGAFGRREVAVSYLRQSVAFADRLKQRVREVEAERDAARRTGEYWKGEHNAANAEIESLRAQLTAATERAELLVNTGRAWLTAVDALVGASGLSHSVPFDIVAAENFAMIAHKNALRAALAAAAPGPVKESLTADAAAPSGETTR